MKTENKNPHKNKVHRILVHSYAVYFLLFLLGVSLDLVFQFRIFSSLFMIPLGIILLIFGTFLIFWAQKTSHHIFGKNVNRVGETITKEIFYRGPYCYTRSPTHWGLFFLILGFGLIVNALFVILLTLFSFLITRFVFLDKHEKVMEEKYGTHYAEYKKMVKF